MRNKHRRDGEISPGDGPKTGTRRPGHHQQPSPPHMVQNHQSHDPSLEGLSLRSRAPSRRGTTKFALCFDSPHTTHNQAHRIFHANCSSRPPFGNFLIEYGVGCVEDGSLRQGLLVSATTLQDLATRGTQTQPRILGKGDSFRVSVGVHFGPLCDFAASGRSCKKTSSSGVVSKDAASRTSS
jgi:hypothetical protein